MNIQVELRAHLGVQPVLDPTSRQALKYPDGQPMLATIDHGQCLVFVDGKQVALYCGRANEPGRFLSFINWYPEPFQKAVAEAVALKTGGVGKVGGVPPEEHDIPDDN